MIRSSLILFLLLIQLSSFAQRPGCDGDRYRNRVFADVDSTIDLVYGSNTSHSGFLVDLFMDIYEPAGDTLTERPVIVIAHGGSFISGDRKQVRQLCLDYAKRGYVAAAINYRLFYNLGTPIDSFGLYDVVVKAVGDMKASIRYIKQTADSGNPYGIDPDWVFASGVSAGGITAMVSTYLTDTSLMAPYFQAIIDSNGGLEGNTMTAMQYSSEVKGIVSYSGAIRDTGWISSDNLIPAFCVHEDMDPIVPYGSAQVTSAGITITLMGSLAVTEKLTRNGTYNDLITFENSGGHVSYFLDTASNNFISILNETASFLNTLYCPEFSDTIIDTSTTIGLLDLASANADMQVFPNPAVDRLEVVFGDQANHRMSIVSMDGAIVSVPGSATSSATLDVSSLPIGVYVLRSESDRQTILHKRFVVQR